MIRVQLIGNYAGDGQESMRRYLRSLTANVSGSELEFNVCRPPVLFGLLAAGKVASKYLGYIDKFVVFPPILLLQARRADIIHICDHSNAMYACLFRRKRTVITCHDVLAIEAARGMHPNASTSQLGKILQRAVLLGLECSSTIICVSAHTAQRLKHLGLNGSKLKIIGNILNWDYRPACQEQVQSILQHLGSDAGYFLHVGGNGWYKNRAGVINIFGEMKLLPEFSNLQLIMAGKRITKEMRDIVNAKGLQSSVIELLAPSNEELNALYSGARALLFPSLGEGFGWPILEAQACGCPVITSDREPMREVAGDAAVFVDPENPLRAAAAIANAAETFPQLREAGFENVKRFNRERFEQEYVDVYRSKFETFRTATASAS